MSLTRVVELNRCAGEKVFVFERFSGDDGDNESPLRQLFVRELTLRGFTGRTVESYVYWVYDLATVLSSLSGSDYR